MEESPVEIPSSSFKNASFNSLGSDVSTFLLAKLLPNIEETTPLADWNTEDEPEEYIIRFLTGEDEGQQ